MDAFKLSMNHKIGKGGYHCYCCGPVDRRHVKKLRRLARHKLHNEMKKELQEAL